MRNLFLLVGNWNILVRFIRWLRGGWPFSRIKNPPSWIQIYLGEQLIGGGKEVHSYRISRCNQKEINPPFTWYATKSGLRTELSPLSMNLLSHFLIIQTQEPLQSYFNPTLGPEIKLFPIDIFNWDRCILSLGKCATRLRKRWGEAPRSRLTGADFKPLQAALVKSQGGERWRKRYGRRPCQVRFRETSVSEPSMRCRNEKDDVRTGGLPNSRRSLRVTRLLLGRRPYPAMRNYKNPMRTSSK